MKFHYLRTSHASRHFFLSEAHTPLIPQLRHRHAKSGKHVGVSTGLSKKEIEIEKLERFKCQIEQPFYPSNYSLGKF